RRPRDRGLAQAPRRRAVVGGRRPRHRVDRAPGRPLGPRDGRPRRSRSAGGPEVVADLAQSEADPLGLRRCAAGRGADHGDPPARIEGREALTAHVREIMTAWPDSRLETSPERAAAGQVTLEWVFRGTQQADYGPLPGQGQALELNGASIMEMDEALIKEERV